MKGLSKPYSGEQKTGAKRLPIRIRKDDGITRRHRHPRDRAEANHMRQGRRTGIKHSARNVFCF